MVAYYNENDAFSAAWLRELINAGHIAPGVVDERSIEDVAPEDIREFTQCHFFAGIGVWSYALRLAGWPDDRPVWTGSCPCQPFSTAGKGAGFDDERHLWPSWYWLISELRPSKIFAEQVASKSTEPWIDLVQSDLEAMDYVFGVVAFPSAGVGAPHIRDRSYWVGDASRNRLSALKRETVERKGGWKKGGATEQSGGSSGRVVDTDSDRENLLTGDLEKKASIQEKQCESEHSASLFKRAGGNGNRRRADSCNGLSGDDKRPRQTNGFWRNADWLLCRDGKWRPVEPGTFPLADGSPQRVGRLRGYGNAINAEAAVMFIKSCEDTE